MLTPPLKVHITYHIISQTIFIIIKNPISTLSDWLYHSPLIRQRVDTTQTYCTLTHTHTHPGH